MNRPRRSSPAAEAKPNVPLDIAASDLEPSISEGSSTDKGMDAVNKKISDNPLISGNSGVEIRKGENPANPPPDTLTNQPLSPKDASPHASMVSTNANAPPLDSTSFHQLQLEPYVSHEINASSYPGYGGGGGTAPWNGYSQYINADGLHVVSPVVYNDNSSLVFHSGYGFNADIAYGQYSPVGTPLPPMMVEGQLYSAPPSQLPFSPSYFPPSNVPHMPSSTEFMTPENASIDSMFFGPGSAYFVNYGGGNQNLISSPLPSPTIYPPPMGILGSYENSFGQVSQQQRSSHGFGLSPQYPLGGSYQSSGFGGASFPYSVSNDLNHLALDKGRRRDRDQDSVSVSNDSRDIFNDRNRGPRASKMKGKSATEQGSLSSAAQKMLSSQKDFVIDYENAKFFIIKSFSEDNVHKSIKYSVWASTPHGNKKLDASYHAAKEIKPKCPLFLFFSVNASGQFCGVAEMVGPVDFEKDAEYWQQDRWNGQFPVQWHIVKDVANIRFRHILLDNNDNKPVTHSRDSQEVGFKHGMEMLKIFKEHEARTCILDDFYFYDDREKALRDRKARQQTCENPRKAGADGEEEEELLSRISQGLVLEDRKVGESSESEAATEDNITTTTLGG